MKTITTLLLSVIAFSALKITHASAGELRWGGSSHFAAGAGHVQSGCGSSFGGHGPYTNYGSSAFRSPSFGHFRRFSQRGMPYFSSGFSQRSFGSISRFGPAGPPPLGAPGPTPFALTNPSRVRFPFFCRLHSFGYTSQKEFFGHLNFAHHIPLDNAGSFCQQVEGGLIFPGF